MLPVLISHTDVRMWLSTAGSAHLQVATVHCAKDLDDDQRYLVAKKLQEMTGQKNIKIKTSIDESLIAGFVVDYGSAQIDLSIKGQLEEVTQELVAGVSAVA